MATRTIFLKRDQYWKEISSRIPSAKKVMAAVAYLGRGGSDYLPLRAGDELVVDLSLGAVKQGVTDPREIEKLIKRGVDVFTRASLHAKLVVIDDVVIASSANASQNARQYLDEAAILTTMPEAVRSAKQFIRSLCSEPVLEGYLKECVAAYKPPVFKGARTLRQPKRRNQRARLWFIGGLEYIDAEKDRDQIEPLEEDAQKELHHQKYSEVGWIRYRNQPRWFSHIQPNNWVIDCTRDARGRNVGSPARVICKRHYKSRTGKTYHMLMLERPIDRENMSLTGFKKRWSQDAPNGIQPPQRSQAITNDTLADIVLRFWTARGRVSKRRAK